MTPHLDRTLAAMAADDLDLLVLGREANARFVAGANRLWLAGSRPFAPGCAVVRATGAVHLLSITDDGVPPDVPPERCYPITWNPMNMMGALAAAPGAAGARRIGVDGMTPMFEQLMHATFPDAELVDGEAVLRQVRRVKDADDVAGVRAAVVVAEDALAAVTDALVPGVRERELLSEFEERMASHGVTTPAFEGTFCVVDPDHTARALVTDRVVRDGDAVHLRGGVLRDGWEGTVARTWPCGGGTLDLTLARGALTRAVAGSVAGARVGAIRAMPGITVDGSGMGHEELHDDDVLEASMVLAVETLVDGALLGDLVLVTAAGPERLTTFPDPAS